MPNQSTIAIVTDSISDLPREYVEKHRIFIMPLTVNVPEGQLLDHIEITPDEVFARMPAVIPTTSQPNPDYVMQVFERIKEEGYSEAIVVCASSAVSGTYAVITLCAEQVKGLRVQTVDTLRFSMASGFMVMQAVEMRDAGASFEQILEALRTANRRSNGFFSLPTLDYLIKGGRIGRVQGAIGNLLGIVPVISISDDGHLYTFAKARSFHKAIAHIEELIRKIVEGKVCELAILFATDRENANVIRDRLKDIKGLRNMFMCQIGPVLGVHAGPGLLGVAYRIV
jgi:DegV family protein with EDD domain